MGGRDFTVESSARLVLASWAQARLCRISVELSRQHLVAARMRIERSELTVKHCDAMIRALGDVLVWQAGATRVNR
jgi:hypothetical protein